MSAPSGDAKPKPPPRPRKTILLVEDDDAVREPIIGMLSRSGYQVLSAATVEEALVLWQGYRSAIQAVVSDCQLGHERDGISLLREFGGQKAKVVLILASGSLTPSLIAELHATTHIQCLPKPFTIEALLAMLASGLLRRIPHTD